MKTLVALLLLLSPFALTEIDTREGYVMPYECRNRSEGTAEDHTTECALEEKCAASGYGLWVEGDFKKFDPAGHQMALEYFKSTARTHNHKVQVSGDFGGEMIVVEKIEPVD